MQCPNCGADLGEAHVCPYCGFEDENWAQQEHEKRVKSIYDKIAALLHTPVEHARKITKGLLIGTALIVFLFLATLLGIYVYSPISENHQLNQQKACLEQLETLYQQGDYQKMKTLLDAKEDSYKAVYDKYRIIGSLSNSLESASTTAVSCAEAMVKLNYPPNFLELPLEMLMDVLHKCRTLEENGFVYDEDPQVLAFSQQAQDVLKNVMLMTPSEIQQALDTYEQLDYSELCNLVAARLREGKSQ